MPVLRNRHAIAPREQAEFLELFTRYEADIVEPST
jgi:hypothetical protein